MPLECLGPSQVHLWLARDPLLRDQHLLDEFSRTLTAEERERAARMHFPGDRHQQLVTRAMVRGVLSRYAPVAPADWIFERSAEGRPRIAGDHHGLHFNLAHTRGLVALAVARVPDLGVDAEHAGKSAPLAVARRYFSAAEIQALDALPEPERPARFRRLWTLKESYLKAIGTGVAGGLGTMTFHLDDGALRFERAADPDAERWIFREFEVAPDFRVALAWLDRAAGHAPEVLLRHFPDGLSGQEERAQS
jgi:4'-phosphopantetheinyl transferase